jgi:hypothetical protein
MTTKEIFIATHGDKYSGVNPAMTPKGFDEVRILRGFLPENPSLVISGIGQRQLDVAEALGLTPDRNEQWAGDGDSMEIIDGKKFAILADGSSIELEKYTVLKDTTPLAIAGVTALPHNAVICGGRPIMIMLGVPSGKSASVYKVVISDDKIVEITVVLITGVVDPALQ